MTTLRVIEQAGRRIRRPAEDESSAGGRVSGPVIPPAPSISQHHAERPLIYDSFYLFDGYLEGLETAYSRLTDPEEAQSAGHDSNVRTMAALSLLKHLREWLVPTIEAELEERAATSAADSIEQQYKGLDPVDDALEIRRLNGDR